MQVNKKASTQNRPPKVNGKNSKNNSTVVLSEDKAKLANKRGSIKLKENLDSSNKLTQKEKHRQDSDRRSTKNMTEKSNSNSMCSSTKNVPKKASLNRSFTKMSEQKQRNRPLGLVLREENHSEIKQYKSEVHPEA